MKTLRSKHVKMTARERANAHAFEAQDSLSFHKGMPEDGYYYELFEREVRRGVALIGLEAFVDEIRKWGFWNEEEIVAEVRRFVETDKGVAE